MLTTFKGLMLIVWLTPASLSAVPVALAANQAECDEKQELYDPVYREFSNRDYDCVRWSYAPETSPRPLPKPEGFGK